MADWSNLNGKELIGIVSWEVNPVSKLFARDRISTFNHFNFDTGSFELFCSQCGGNPDVFTRVFSYKNWILKQMYANSDLE